MIFPTTISKFFPISFSLKSYISFNENIKFSIIPQKTAEGKYKFQIQDCCGNFYIRYVYSKGINQYIPFNKDTQSFVVKKCSNKLFEFTIFADISFQEIKDSQNSYNLYITCSRLQSLNPLEFYRQQFNVAINDDDTVTLTYFVKKLAKTRIQVVIENNYDGLKINGKDGNFEYYTTEEKEILATFFFTFDSSEFEEYKQLKEKKTSESFNTSNILSKQNCIDPSKKICSKLYKIMSNQKYSDVILISSDNIHVGSYRSVLANSSKIFEKIIDEASELPVTINVENYNAEIIKAGLNFLYDKNDAIDGKEIDVFKFGVEYGIQDIMDACCSYFEKSVDSTNVCEYIQIAYSNNFEELKKKCLKILVEKKKEIAATKFKTLPKNILFDAFFGDAFY